jgi:hypothetical protein
MNKYFPPKMAQKFQNDRRPKLAQHKGLAFPWEVNHKLLSQLKPHIVR